MASKMRTRSASSRENDNVPKKAKLGESTKKMIKLEIKETAAEKVPVDPECLKLVSNAHVYCCKGDTYSITLSQTNINRNNNKFYMIQLVEDDSRNYSVWTRWGRIGVVGQHNLACFGSELEAARNEFCKKFTLKTKNDWNDRKHFVKVEGKYGIVEVSHEEQKKPQKVQQEPKSLTSNLPEKIQKLIKMISNVQEMEDMVKSMKYDSSRAPLGELTKKQIKNGFSTLKKISGLINASNIDELTQACDKYYTQIPHNFGMRTPPLIRSVCDLQREIDLLETLGEIELAFRILQGSDVKNVHPIDAKYHSLKCNLQPVEKDDDNFKMIENYLQVTHGQTHNSYTMVVTEIFSIDRLGEKEKFLDAGNKMLLWHGTRSTNMIGILSQGLRIAPPEAPATGYMFGKGVYFADISSKSANYCYTTKKKNVGFLILSQVSLGNQKELLQADMSADKLPKDVHSVKGVGMVWPNPEKNIVWEDGTIVPTGEPIEEQKSGTQATKVLNYNEYIVYNPDQIRMRFLVQVEFKYK